MSDLQLLKDMRAEIKSRRRVRHFTNFYHKLLGRDNTREVVRHGLRWKLKYSGIEGSIIKKACWERDTVEYFFTQAHAQKYNMFLDIGANIGYYSMLAAKTQLFEKIHAFEAMPDAFERLCWHIDENGFANTIEPHQIAVSDSSGKIRISAGTILSKQAKIVDKGADESIEVDAATLDSLLDFHGRKLAVKIDIEGHEIPALRGAEKLFAQNDIFLQVEVWQESTETINYLAAQGFRMVHYVGENFYFERECCA